MQHHTSLTRTRFARAAVAVSLPLVLALSACSGGAEADSAAPAAAPSGKADPAASAAVPDSFKKAGVIKVASDIPYPPMEFFDDDQNLIGFDVDLAKALGDRLGVKLELQKQSFDSIIPSLQSGKHDIIMSGMNDTAEREQALDFVDYLHAGFSILVKKGNPEKITGILDLCGKNVAVQKATVQGDMLRGYEQKCKDKGSSGINVSELPLETDVQTAVRSGKAVADVSDSPASSYTAKTADGGNAFEIVTDPANPSGYMPVHTGIGVLKKDSGLSKALELGMKSLLADGSYAKILDKYGLSDFAVKDAGMNLGKDTK
ncbi:MULTISPECIES: ABC transporter substrate-binding protein [Arthrobacter]|uniref:ABC transporter substrate-binding protein n=2 Tax=Arthrobacter TaxID=1663 RepID=A0ABU9KH98_9MICC|nr:ABC transporter substrate-binding protein [Arthrobacter sp. YJM1]MDP5226264.1 ABC transporter substrate-binding protein [Arthrobacter sp. YJM1]